MLSRVTREMKEAPTVARARADVVDRSGRRGARGRARSESDQVGDRMAGRLVLRQVSADAAVRAGASAVRRLHGRHRSHSCRQTLVSGEETGSPEAPKPSSGLKPARRLRRPAVRVLEGAAGTSREGGDGKAARAEQAGASAVPASLHPLASAGGDWPFDPWSSPRGIRRSFPAGRSWALSETLNNRL